MRAYIALGSNLAEPLQQIQIALRALANMPHSKVVRSSSFYCTQPWGVTAQPDFINSVAEVETELTPLDLLQQLWRIENQQGRVRGDERYGPRTLDLDILLYGDQIINTPELQIPHPRMGERDFVLYPLAEIAPTLMLPTGESLLQLQAACPPRGIYKLEASQ